MMTHREFLDKFGPAKNAADEYGVSVISINHWKSRGIPPAYWLRSLSLSLKHEFGLVPDDLIVNSPSKRVQSILGKIPVENGTL